MNHLPDLELTLPARADNVGVVRHLLGGVAEALSLESELLDDIRLAVSEACANAVVHAYAGGAGLMDVAIHATAHELLISVRDHGAGMAPRADSPGLGVGLPLMASLASSMELLTPPGGGTEVRMRFPLPDRPPAGEGEGDEHGRRQQHDPSSSRPRPAPPGPRTGAPVHEHRR